MDIVILRKKKPKKIYSYKWHHVVFFYERNGHYNVAGLHTCHLLMQTMANTYRNKNITYSSFSTDSAVTNHTENLRREVGLDQSSKCIYFATFIFVIFAEIHTHDLLQYIYIISHFTSYFLISLLKFRASFAFI